MCRQVIIFINVQRTNSLKTTRQGLRNIDDIYVQIVLAHVLQIGSTTEETNVENFLRTLLGNDLIVLHVC